MKDRCCFFNVHNVNSGILAGIGDACFAPIRYFFHGKTVWNTNDEMRHVSSFHREPCHRSNLIKYLDIQSHNISTEYCSYQKN